MHHDATQTDDAPGVSSGDLVAVPLRKCLRRRSSGDGDLLGIGEAEVVRGKSLGRPLERWSLQDGGGAKGDDR